MIAVFISFGLGDMRTIKVFGVTMAVSVFLDAVVIRSILLPAVIELFGERTWAFPKGLDRALPRLAIEAPTTSAEPQRQEMIEGVV